MNIKQIEEKWRKTQLKFSNKELAKLFPEVKLIILKKITSLEVERADLLDDMKHKLQRIWDMQISDFSRWFYRTWLKLHDCPKLLETEKEIQYFKRFINGIDGKRKKTKNRIDDDKVEQALDVPIESIIRPNIQLNKAGKNYIGLCPFHMDKHPSFYLYTDTNSFYCFGCQTGGNVINYVMQFYGYDFIEAVKWLIGEN